MAELTERMDVAETILKTLSNGSMRRTALEKKVFRTNDISYSCFTTMFTFLLSDGDIEKTGSERTSPYRLTAKGKAFLAWRTTA